MTEIEEKFYRTFGIKPKKVAPEKYTDLLVDGVEHIYPPITDRILLELICIYNKATLSDDLITPNNIKTLKYFTLEFFIEEKLYKDNNVKQAVRNLFESEVMNDRRK